jgi:hypothetical protein
MRRLTALATLVLLFAAGCTGEEPGTEETPSGEESSSAEAAPTAPLELALEPPTGFTAAAGEDREILFAENHVSYVFYVAGAEGGLDKIIVSSYLLPQGTDTASYDSQAGIVTDYFKQLNSIISLDNFYPTIVHRYDGIYRYGEKEVNGVELKWQDHFVFAGPYLINITCQWDAHYSAIDSACAELTSSFPYPEEWAAASATV